jgi:hypothetical protein
VLTKHENYALGPRESLLQQYNALTPLCRMPSTEVRNLYEQLRTNTIDLYSQILKYQLHIARQYSRAGFFRFLRDFVALDEWKDMIGTLEKTEDNIRKDLRELDSGTLDTIALNVSNLQGKADDILIKLKEVRREVEV